MSVNHGRAYILVPQKLLHGSDIIVILQQVSGERVPEGVAGCCFDIPALFDSPDC